MAEQEKVATFVTKAKKMRGDAACYRLSPPMVDTDWRGTEAHHEYVIVSANDVMFSGPETYIFPGDEEGNVTDWGELPGSFKGDLDHERALSGAGYVLAGER